MNCENTKEPINKEYFELDEKNKVIRKKIAEQPGIHLFELENVTGYPRATIWYRLNKMERVKLVKLVRGIQSLRCYPGDQPIPERVIPEYIPLVNGVVAGGR